VIAAVNSFLEIFVFTVTEYGVAIGDGTSYAMCLSLTRRFMEVRGERAASSH